MGVQNLPTANDMAFTNSAEQFVSSKLFTNLFSHGMELVDETAGYLDGEGRDAAKKLPRQLALGYAGVSMRLTTKLMQIASWLLVLRAVREEEMSYSEAAQSKYRIGAPEPEHDMYKGDDNMREKLPDLLVQLINDTDALYTRIARIDADIFTEQKSPIEHRDASSQIKALEAAFGASKK